MSMFVRRRPQKNSRGLASRRRAVSNLATCLAYILDFTPLWRAKDAVGILLCSSA